jgi:PAS domain S-box-containing protein
LRENEARLRALTDNLPAGMVYQVTTGVDGSERRFLYVSGSHERLTGVPADAVLADPTIPYFLVHPEDRPALEEAEAQALSARQPFDVQVRFRRVDGELRWCRIISAPREQPDGSLIWDGIQIDTTEQKNAEQALRESQQRLRELNDNLEAQVAERTADRDRMWRLSTDIMLVARIDGSIGSVNPAWTTLLGWTQDELVGTNFMDLVHADDKEATLAEMGKLGDGATTFRFENRYRAADGGHCWISWTAVPARTSSTRSAATSPWKRSARRSSRPPRRRCARRRRWRRWASSPAASRMISTICSRPSSAASTCWCARAGQRARAPADRRRLQSAERAKTLVQRLLAFARRQPLQPQPVDLRRLVTGMADLISSTSGPNIDVHVDLPEDLPPATADGNQVEMALLNLAVNARDAMPGRRLADDPPRAGDGQRRRKRSSLRRGHYVRLSVTEPAGHGRGDAERAVEPFSPPRARQGQPALASPWCTVLAGS